MADQSQHYVPQMYLKGFLDPEQVKKRQNVLWIYRAGMKPQPKGTKAVAAKNLFYQMPEVPDHQDDIEEALSQMESAAAPHLEKLRSGDINLTGQEKGEFAWFMALLVSRTPFFRDLTDTLGLEEYRQRMEKFLEPGALEAGAEKLKAKTGQAVDIESVREYARKVAKREVEITQQSRAWSIMEAFKAIPRFGELFARMRWGLNEGPADGPFITSDNPVIVLDDNARKLGPKNYRPTLGLRFGFPISPKFALSGEFVPGADQRLKADAKWVRSINSSQISRAYVEVYASFKSMDIQAEIDKVHKERPSVIPNLPADHSRFEQKAPEG